MPRPNLKSGDRFGRLVLEQDLGLLADKGQRRRTWLSLCDCGNRLTVWQSQLVSRRKQSCGCLVRDTNTVLAKQRASHGEATRGAWTPEYRSWVSMNGRCSNPADSSYPRYGGRGITVGQQWQDSYPSFLRDMGRRPSLAHTLDRIDVNGNYEPGNCRWSTPQQQGRNRRSNRLLTISGETRTVSEWAAATGLRRETILKRLRLGWTEERAVRTPVPTRGR
jgi:hypothetical protein